MPRTLISWTASTRNTTWRSCWERKYLFQAHEKNSTSSLTNKKIRPICCDDLLTFMRLFALCSVWLASEIFNIFRCSDRSEIMEYWIFVSCRGICEDVLLSYDFSSFLCFVEYVIRDEKKNMTFESSFSQLSIDLEIFWTVNWLNNLV